MARVTDFRQLAAWQRAEELRGSVEEVVRRARAAKDFKYGDQLSDAASSGPRNIAEGFGRFRHPEFANFVRIAKGSETEVLSLLVEAASKGYIKREDFAKYETCAKRAIGTAVGLIRYRENSDTPPNAP